MFAKRPTPCRFRVSDRASTATTLIIEPWASEYPLPPGKTYLVVAEGDLAQPFEVEWRDDRVVVYAIDDAGSLLTVYDGDRALP